MMRSRARIALLCAAFVLAPCAAGARASATLDGGNVVFFSETLTLIARDGAKLTLADGTRASADAAYLDLRNDRAVLAGHARIARGTASASADAIALELRGERVDLLEGATGVRRTTRALGAASPAEFEADRFAFPDVDDRFAFIKSRKAAIAPEADVRFTPASFPTSVGSVPVPSYLYTYATGAGFASTSLPGATFDQPYGLWGSPTSLTALHARWEDGPGAALALQQQIVSGDDAYVTASVDAPLRGSSVRGLNAYRRLGGRYTVSADATQTIFGTVMHGGLRAAFGAAGGGLDYTHTSLGTSSFTASLRTPDRPLLGALAYRLTGTLGFDAVRGGVLYQLPDRRSYQTVWRHGLDLFVSAPEFGAPLGTRIATSLDASRTWYAFPHYFDSLATSVTASRALVRNVKLFAGYQATWSSDVYPNAQAIFYSTPIQPLITPDGTPYIGYAAFSGAKTFRAVSADLQFLPNGYAGTTSYRLTVTHTDDFPQFHGFGRPQWEARGDLKFRPFRNIGIDVARAYDFAWGGTRWVPRWSIAITP